MDILVSCKGQRLSSERELEEIQSNMEDERSLSSLHEVCKLWEESPAKLHAMSSSKKEAYRKRKLKQINDKC